MITSYYDWEERQHVRQVQESLNAMVSPSVQDAAELAERLNQSHDQLIDEEK